MLKGQSQYLEQLKTEMPDLRQYLGLLDERSGFILAERLKGRSLREIGGELHIQPERVRQIEGAACFRLMNKRKRLKHRVKDILRPSEVARLLGIHVNTVRRWSEKGILECYRLGPRGDRRFRREDALRVLKESQ